MDLRIRLQALLLFAGLYRQSLYLPEQHIGEEILRESNVLLYAGWRITPTTNGKLNFFSFVPLAKLQYKFYQVSTTRKNQNKIKKWALPSTLLLLLRCCNTVYSQYRTQLGTKNNHNKRVKGFPPYAGERGTLRVRGDRNATYFVQNIINAAQWS